MSKSNIIYINDWDSLARVYVPIPKQVRDNAAKGLALAKLYERGGTEVGLAMAEKLQRGGRIDLLTVVKVSEYFPRHAGDRLGKKNPPSNGYIAWMLWGGDAGRSWSTRIAKRLRHKK